MSDILTFLFLIMHFLVSNNDLDTIASDQPRALSHAIGVAALAVRDTESAFIRPLSRRNSDQKLELDVPKFSSPDKLSAESLPQLAFHEYTEHNTRSLTPQPSADDGDGFPVVPKLPIACKLLVSFYHNFY